MPAFDEARGHGISVPAAGTVHAYADGACSGNPGPGGWASVVVTPAGHASGRSGAEVQSTNNRMEIMAARDAVSRAVTIAGTQDGTKAIVVHVDSTYVRDGIGSWIKGWKRNGWRTAAGQPVKNKELWQDLDTAVSAARTSGYTVEFAWVKGHSGHPGNERCDLEARLEIAALPNARRLRPGTAGMLLAMAALSSGLMLHSVHAQGLPAALPPEPTASQQPQETPGGAAAAGAGGEQQHGPALSSPIQGGWIVNGGAPGDWGFMMGPTGSPNMQLKLIRSNPDHSGAIGFMCSRKEGSMQMALALPGVSYELGKPQDLNLTVADRSNKIGVVVRSAPDVGQPPVFETSGPAIPDVLKAMGAVPDSRTDGHLTFDDGAGHTVSFGLTHPRSVASQTGEICSGWAMGAAADRTGTVDMPDPPPSAHPPGLMPSSGQTDTTGPALPTIPTGSIGNGR
jgi:ribonuclease HI